MQENTVVTSTSSVYGKLFKLKMFKHFIEIFNKKLYGNK